MFKPSRWMGLLKKRRNNMKLMRHSGAACFNNNKAKYRDLIRADLNNRLREKRKGGPPLMSANPLPFVLNTSGSAAADGSRHFIYKTYYCTIPPPSQRRGDQSSFPTAVEGDEGGDGAAVAGGKTVKDFNAWVSRVKSDPSGGKLFDRLEEPMRRNDKALLHPETLSAINHFLVQNMFILEGYHMWTRRGAGGKARDEPTTEYVTVIYHRTMPAASSEGSIAVDPNLLVYMEAQSDASSELRVATGLTDEQRQLIAGAERGIKTDIGAKSVPTDKALYASVTCALRPVYDL